MLDTADTVDVVEETSIQPNVDEQDVALSEREFKSTAIYAHARRELDLLGYIDLDIEQEDGPNRWIQENLLELLDVFNKQGHSGFSAEYCINAFSRLARFQPLSFLTCEDSEWTDITEMSNKPCFQNKRNSAVFKDDKDSLPYYINAVVFTETLLDEDLETYESSFTCSDVCLICNPSDTEDNSLTKMAPWEMVLSSTQHIPKGKQPKTFHLKIMGYLATDPKNENIDDTKSYYVCTDYKTLLEILDYYEIDLPSTSKKEMHLGLI